jgi:hypothetical protein
MNWDRMLSIALGLALLVFVLGLIGGRRHDDRPKCTSAISSIRIVGNQTVRSGVVWYPKGCKHPPNR